MSKVNILLNTNLKLYLSLYAVLLWLYSFFSYSLTSPNLVLTSWAPYWQFQTWMWQTFFNNRPLLTYTYLALVLALFAIYIPLVRALIKVGFQLNLRSFVLYIALIAPLLFANNALSYDIFNYIFNAKMVAIYQANPHVQVALEFAQDPWVRFMHNTHTPAPYGYGWTGISVLAFYLGMGKFLPTWLIFRGLSLLSLAGLWWIYRYYTSSETQTKTAWLFFNPLFLLEILATSHNDLWMMAPAVLALCLVNSSKKWTIVGASALLLAFSISIKLATLVLVPLWVYLVVVNFWPTLLKPLAFAKPLWPLIAAVLLFIPLLTGRAQQFHPWYLTWVLVWLPLFSDTKWPSVNWAQNWWSRFMYLLSFTSLLRYIPYFWAGSFQGDVLLQQKMITWSAGLLVLAWICSSQLSTSKKN